MIGGKPAVFISCSERFREQVANPLKTALWSLGVHGIIVSEEPRPPGRAWEPEDKVDSLLRSTDGFVALVTPDDKLADGRFRCRPNITDEIARARADPRLQNHMIIAKAPEVDLWSNINPTYDQLSVEDPAPAIEVIVQQLRNWGIVPPTGQGEHPTAVTSTMAQGLSPHAHGLLDNLQLGDDDEAQRRVYRLFRELSRDEQRQIVDEVVGFANTTDDHERMLVACTVVEAADRLDPALIDTGVIEQLAKSPEFSIRSAAAVLLWQRAQVASCDVSVALLGRLAEPVREDWYVQAPAIAAVKQLMLRRPEASEILNHLADRTDPEERYAAVMALIEVARVLAMAVPPQLAQRLAQDSDSSVAQKGAELLRAIRGVSDEDRRRYFSSFGM